MVFPKAPWAIKYFDALIAFCDKEELNYSIESEIPGESLKFLYLNFGEDVVAANKCISAIYTQVFRVKASTKLFVCLQGASIS